jgi:hypothetical protein
MLEEHAYVPGAVCVHCGMKHGQQRYDSHDNPSINKNLKPVLVVLTINHKTRDLYLNKDLYLTWNPNKMEVCCTLCNKRYEGGYKPCPKCLKEGFVKYIKWYDEECSACYFKEHPVELKKAIEGRNEFKESIRVYNKNRAKNARDKKKKHSCKHYRVGGKCGKSKVDSRCTYSPRNAVKNCGEFEEKVLISHKKNSK